MMHSNEKSKREKRTVTSSSPTCQRVPFAEVTDPVSTNPNPMTLDLYCRMAGTCLAQPRAKPSMGRRVEEVACMTRVIVAKGEPRQKIDSLKVSVVTQTIHHQTTVTEALVIFNPKLKTSPARKTRSQKSLSVSPLAL